MRHRVQSFGGISGVADLSEARYEAPVVPASTSSPTVGAEPSTITQYFQDVRRFSLLTHEREIALARTIQEGTRQWREALQQHLLHVPLLLACRARLRRGMMPLADLCGAEQMPALQDFVTILDHLQRLRCQMRQEIQSDPAVGEDTAARIATLRGTMQTLLAPFTWQPMFLQQAWGRFDTAMAAASPTRQRQQARRFLTTLGHTLAALRTVWRRLHRLYDSVESAKQEMITRNLRLVISVAREFHHSGMQLTDLIQEGNIGLMRAVDKFDYRRNLKFSTYAIWWIKQAMRRAVFEQSALIRIPEYMYESARLVYRNMPALISELGRTPTPTEVAQRLAMPVERVERSLALVSEPISLDQPLADEDRRTLSDRLADPHLPLSADALVQQDLIDQTHRVLAELEPREAEVIRRRFGLHGQPGETLRQIGVGLHLSHERVRQIEAEALAKLKRQGATLRVFLES